MMIIIPYCLFRYFIAKDEVAPGACVTKSLALCATVSLSAAGDLIRAA
jgi:hypothetical protein